MSITLGSQATTKVQPLHRSRIYWAVADALVLAWRNLARLPRIPEEIVFATIQPIMFVVLFRYVFGGAISGTGTSYINYLMAGIFVQTVAFGSVSTGIGLAEDLQKGLVDRFRSLPMSRSAVLTGRTISDLVRNMFIVIVMLLVGLLVGFRLQGNVGGWLIAGGVLLLFGLTLSWVGAAIGLMMRSVEAAQSAGFIWLFPLTFASSAFVPLKTMPSWLQSFASHQPLTLVIDTIRNLLLGQPVTAEAWQGIAWCIGIIVVFVPLAVWAYQRRTSR